MQREAEGDATVRRLVSFATERGLWAMAAFMLPLASRGAPSVPALLQAIDAVAADGWGLLHKAVLSGDILMAQVCSPHVSRLVARRFPLQNTGESLCAVAAQMASLQIVQFRRVASCGCLPAGLNTMKSSWLPHIPALLTVASMNAQALIEYAKRHGHVLAADDKGPMGVTALHLAALLPDNGAMAELLVLQCLPGEPLEQGCCSCEQDARSMQSTCHASTPRI